MLARSFAVCAVFILGAGPGASAGGGKVGDDPIEVAQQQAPLAPSAQAGPGDRNVPEKAFFEEFGGLLRFDSLGRDATSYLVFATASGIVSVLV